MDQYDLPARKQRDFKLISHLRSIIFLLLFIVYIFSYFCVVFLTGYATSLGLMKAYLILSYWRPSQLSDVSCFVHILIFIFLCLNSKSRITVVTTVLLLFLHLYHREVILALKGLIKKCYPGARTASYVYESYRPTVYGNWC